MFKLKCLNKEAGLKELSFKMGPFTVHIFYATLQRWCIGVFEVFSEPLRENRNEHIKYVYMNSADTVQQQEHV